MYNASHRGMVAGGQPSASNQRLIELLDQVRQEFDAQAGRTGEYEAQFQQQLHEMEVIRSKVYSMERQHQEYKAKYEEELARMREQLERAGVNAPSSHLGGSHQPGPSQAPPPVVGHGPSNLFGGIMAGGGAQGGPSLAPPQEQAPPQNLPPHIAQGPPGAGAALGGPQPPPFAGYPPGPNGYPQQPPPPQAGSPGPRGPRSGPAPRGPPGPPTPQQNNLPQYGGSPQVGTIPNVGNMLAELDPNEMPQHKVKQGADWYCIFNPRAHRTLDVDLVHNLPHASVVCCVRFSHDGRYVATGCNRSAQIFDVESGNLVAHLQDQSCNLPG